MKFDTVFLSPIVGFSITTPEMRWIEVNDAACTMLGYSRAELLTKTWVDLTHPDDLDRDLQSYYRLLRGELDSYALEKRYVRRDGSILYARLSVSAVRDDQGNVTSCLALLQDISSLHLALERIRQQHVALQTVIGTAPSPMIVFDARGTVILNNDAGAKLLSALSISDLSPYLDGEDIPSEELRPINHGFRCILAGALEQRIPEVRIELGGEPHFYQMTLRPLRSPDSGALQILLVGDEITERKAREEQKLLYERQLHQSQKMEAVGQLAAGVAHDINNALAGIAGHLQLLAYDTSLPEASMQSVRTALRGCDRTSVMVRRLLTFARQTPEERKLVNLGALIDESLALVRSTIPSTVTLSLKISNREELLLGDEILLHQVITNLVMNAVQAMPAGGELTIATDLATCPQPAAPRSERNWITITVTDTGVGIPREVLPRIFEPFFTTKPAGAGTGLGLAMVYGICQQHGGWVEVVSEPDAGATFTVFLPQADNDQKTERKVAHQPTAPNSGVILVIDDEPELVELSTEFFSLAGYRAFGFSDPTEALTWFERHAYEVDLVVLDLNMPQLRGELLLQTLQEIHPGVRVVVLSGYIEEWRAQALLNDGALRVFQKPVSYPELVSWISQAISTPEPAHH